MRAACNSCNSNVCGLCVFGGLQVDSTDRARIALAKEELHRLLAHVELNRAVVLVLANKQDLKDAMTAAEISESLGLVHVTSHNWHLQACCALTGEGLFDGLGWIAQQVSECMRGMLGLSQTHVASILGDCSLVCCSLTTPLPARHSAGEARRYT